MHYDALGLDFLMTGAIFISDDLTFEEGGQSLRCQFPFSTHCLHYGFDHLVDIFSDKQVSKRATTSLSLSPLVRWLLGESATHTFWFPSYLRVISNFKDIEYNSVAKQLCHACYGIFKYNNSFCNLHHTTYDKFWYFLIQFLQPKYPCVVAVMTEAEDLSIF